MDFMGAVHRLKDGKPMRRKSWSRNPRNDNYHKTIVVECHYGRVMSVSISGSMFTCPDLTIADFEADDWELAD